MWQSRLEQKACLFHPSGVACSNPVYNKHDRGGKRQALDRKSTRLNSSHSQISYAVFCLKKKIVMGTGQSQVLCGLVKYPLDITVLVVVFDNGGLSEHRHKIFGIPQVGDIRNFLASFADV